MQASRILIIFLYVATASLSALALTSCDFVGLKTEGGTDDVVGRMKAPLDTYHNHTGAYPSTGDGLHALLENPRENGSNWKGPYIGELPVDAWGNVLMYKSPGVHNPDSYDLWSVGPDGISGTEDDIGNW